MAEHTLSLLYGSKIEDDAVAVLVFMNRLAAGLGVTVEQPLEIDQLMLVSVLKGIRADFPHKDGLEKASVFKKVANFVVHCVAQRPFPSPFPKGSLNQKLRSIPNHQNAVLAFEMAVSALHGATVDRSDASVRLEKPIEVSQHSYVDIIEALSDATAATHYRMTCVLLEQLAYRANEKASYPCSAPPPAGK